MDAIAEICERFETYPDVRIEKGEGWIRCLPNSAEGFVVELLVRDGDYIVAFEGWHEHFGDAESALNCFAFGLSNTCRLKVVSRGGAPHRWIVESLDNGEWTIDSETGNFIFKFWHSPSVSYRQNGLVNPVDAD